MLPASLSHERPELPRHDPLPRPAAPPRGGIASVVPLDAAASPDAALLRDVVSAAESDGCRPLQAKVERQAHHVVITLDFATPWRAAEVRSATPFHLVGDLARKHSAAVTSVASCGDGLVTVAFLVAAPRR
jgi:hypothetical protein